MSQILVIDRTAATRPTWKRLLAEELGYEAEFAEAEAEVLSRLAQQLPDAILLNPVSEGWDGPRFVELLHDRFPQIPIVLITTKGHEAVAIRALAHGASNYVPRHLLKSELADTLRSVLQASQQKRCTIQLLERMTEFRCRFELSNDRTLLPAVVSYLQEHLVRLRFCDASTVIRAGIAIDEALVNALCHGNLELNSDLREQDSEAYERQAKERALQPPYCHRRIHVEAHISREVAEISVTDDGPGFDPQGLADPTDPENMDKVSGRGVHLMRSFMDEVKFNDRGNCVSLVLRNRC